MSDDFNVSENDWTNEAFLEYCIFKPHLLGNQKTFFEIEDTGETYILNFYPSENEKHLWDDLRREREHDPFSGTNYKGDRNNALIINLKTHDLNYAKSITKYAEIKLDEQISNFPDKIFDFLPKYYNKLTKIYKYLEEQIKQQLQINPPEPVQTKTSDQPPASDRQLETAQKTGYVQGVCESVLAFNNDENRKIMTEATMSFLSKKLLSEMNVTKDMAQKFASPETYKALEKCVFTPKQEQKLEQTQSQGLSI